jgi:hypothetical protein
MNRGAGRRLASLRRSVRGRVTCHFHDQRARAAHGVGRAFADGDRIRQMTRSEATGVDSSDAIANCRRVRGGESSTRSTHRRSRCDIDDGDARRAIHVRFASRDDGIDVANIASNRFIRVVDAMVGSTKGPLATFSVTATYGAPHMR